MTKSRAVQYLIFLVLSFVSAPIVIDHAIVLDAKFVFERTTPLGWLLTGCVGFLALVILELALNARNYFQDKQQGGQRDAG